MIPGVLGTAGLAGLAGWAWAARWERYWIQVTRRDIPLVHLPADLEGLTLAHLSDLHYGPMVSCEFLRRVIARTNALCPDIVAITGDFIDRRPAEIAPVAREVGRLRARYGVWAVLGGHDVRASERLSAEAFREQGVRLLLNDAAPVLEGSPVWIAGIRDNSEYYLDQLDRALAPVPPDACTLLLAHSPDIAPRASRSGVDLVLSGHTHGGQVCFPLFGPLITESHYWRRFGRGLTRTGNTWVYTSRGAGVVRLPLRFLCRPEIALHRLVSARGVG